MSQFMTHLLYSSFSGAILIAAVLCIRFLIAKRAPRWISCLLWGLVGVRLLVPFSIESELSILPEIELSVEETVSDRAPSQAVSDTQTEETSTNVLSDAPSREESDVPSVAPPVSVPPQSGEVSSTPSVDESEEEISHETGDEASQETGDESDVVSEETTEPSDTETPDVTGEQTSVQESVPSTSEQSEDVTSAVGGEGGQSEQPTDGADKTNRVLATVWGCGVGALVLYAVIQYLLLRRRVAVFSVDQDGVRRCEMIDTPFVLGVFRPHVYLPYGLKSETERYIIAHERAHIRRFDHATKLIAFACLALHWFNPLVWAAFVMFCRDIEYACDEKVVRTLTEEERKQYAQALLTCAIRNKM